MPYEELLSTLNHLHTYEIEIETMKYQAEGDFAKDCDADEKLAIVRKPQGQEQYAISKKAAA